MEVRLSPCYKGGLRPGTSTDARGWAIAARLYSTAPVDDGAGWVTGDTNPGIDTSYTLDTAGRSSTITQAGMTWTKSAYDLAGRATQTSDPDAGTTTTTFNDLGETVQTVTSRGAAGTASYVYDGLGRQVEQWTGSAGTGTSSATRRTSASIRRCVFVGDGFRGLGWAGR
jgi:YD repeat-containing protein